MNDNFKFQTVNNRMKYALDLSQFIPVDIIGQCWDSEKGRKIQIDKSTHGNDHILSNQHVSAA